VILDIAQPRPGGALLDLGCGDGSLTVRVAQRAGTATIVGVEFDPPGIVEARRRSVHVVEADLTQRLPFDDGAFDVIHSNQVIEHLADTDHFIGEIRRLLRPGGYAVVSTNNLASWHNVVSLVLGYQPPPCHVSNDLLMGNPANFVEGEVGAAGQMHLRIFTGRALAALATHHGLAVETQRTAGFYPLPPRLARVATRLDPRHGAFLVQRYGIARS
jgi:methionine biosynthesis protein MetW